MKKEEKNGVTLYEIIVVAVIIFILFKTGFFDLFRGDPFSYDSFTDSRDGQTYKTVKIGEQVWMAENLRFKTENSICFLNDERECSKGRFYPNIDANEIIIYGGTYLSKDKKICPDGWHLPNTNEIAILINELTKMCGDRCYDSNSPINIFWGKGLGYYEDSKIIDGIGSYTVGYWLLSDGKYVSNKDGIQRTESLESLYHQIVSKFNIRCIANKNEK